MTDTLPPQAPHEEESGIGIGKVVFSDPKEIGHPTTFETSREQLRSLAGHAKVELRVKRKGKRYMTYVCHEVKTFCSGMKYVVPVVPHVYPCKSERDPGKLNATDKTAREREEREDTS